uniref:Uncharacterized protein n=1 Tax=Arundo donax TaxID=35708 RepID=A0A0A9G6Y0_ARUDO
MPLVERPFLAKTRTRATKVSCKGRTPELSSLLRDCMAPSASPARTCAATRPWKERGPGERPAATMS